MARWLFLQRASDGKKIKVPFDKLDEQSQSQAKSLSLLPPTNGKHVQYYESGQKGLEGHYKDSIPEGPYTRWHENGQKSEETHRKNGKLDVLFEWHEGSPMAVGRV